jgi:ferredoxin-NADP reductase
MFHPFRITAVRDLNAFVRLLRAEQVAQAGPRLNFRPGQWADVALGEAEVQARRQRQALDIVGVGGYSFISAPESLPTVEFAIQREAAAERIEAGGASAVSMTRWIHSADCREGVELQLRAGGRFVLEPAPGHAGDAPQKLTLVAAGIGLTPFLSFLRSSVRCGRGASTTPTGALLSHVSLLYSARGMSERGVFVDELKELVVENGMPSMYVCTYILRPN